MYFLNLTALEFFALLGAISAVVTALYLYDRRRTKLRVSTLRFWPEAARSPHQRSKRRLEQPWSLLLQLAGLALLLLALAQVEWGHRASKSRNHVLLLDTSSAAAESLQEEKRLALKYVNSLNPADHVMMVEAAGLITPRTAFTNNLGQVRQFISQAQPAATALSITRALNFASKAQTWPSGEPGEIVYVGPERVTDTNWPEISDLRLIEVAAPPTRSVLTNLSARPAAIPNEWEAVATVNNLAEHASRETLHMAFGATVFAPREVTLQPGQSARLEYRFIANDRGALRVYLSSGSEATLELPVNKPARVTIFTNRPEVFRPLLQADFRLKAQYLPTSAYRASVAGSDVVILDRFSPRVPPQRPALEIDPPADHSPLPVRTVAVDERIVGWTADPELGRGLHSRDLELKNARVYDIFADDIPIANVKDGPVAVARPADGSHPREVIAGFDVASGTSEYRVSTPLLIENALRWLVPNAFAPAEINCRQAGLADISLTSGETSNPLQVTDDHGNSVAYSVRGDTLEFYEDHPGRVRVLSSERDRVASLTLPETALHRWHPQRVAALGVPEPWINPIGPRWPLWRAFAVAGMLILASEWLLYGGRKNAWRMALKLASAVAVAVALVIPALHIPQQKTAVVALVDVSASISHVALQQATRELREIASQRGRNWMAVLPFSLHPSRDGGSYQARLEPATLRPEARGTDLEAALTEGIGSVPDGYLPRVLLLSDGNENRGSAVRAIAELRRIHVPVDTIPLNAATPDDVAVIDVSMARDAFAGEQIPLDLTVVSPRDTDATVYLRADGHTLGGETLRLHRGSNHVRVHARVNTTGAVTISGSLVTRDAGDARFTQVVQLRRATILYLSQDPPDTSTNLLAAFRSAGFSIDTNAKLLDGTLSDVSLVVLNNLDLATISPDEKGRLANFVSAGGGLLIIGGERQIYKEDKQLDSLDAVLPAKLAPPRTPEGMCVALVIDKSSSMEGRKIQLARLSAIGVVDHLTPRDMIGVLIFDNSYQWAVPIRKATEKPTIKRLISGITPDGGTQIAPALAEAYRKVIRKSTAYKHIVLLTDGISEEGDSLDLAREAQSHSVTISTVGLGQDVNRSYLEKIASISGGQSYFLNNPQGLEQLLLKDVQDYSGTSTVEKPLTVSVKQQAAILDGVDFKTAPPLKGYARFEAKPDAETLLTVDGDQHDPLLVRWQYGLGRAAVFASDAKSRWAEQWMSWGGFDRLWINIARDLIGDRTATEASANFDGSNELLTVRYQIPESMQEPVRAPQLFVLGPGGFASPMTLEHPAPHVYQGQIRVPPDAQEGVFRARPVSESRAFPEVGVYRALDEFSQRGVNEPLLREIADATGGRFNPAPESIFDANGRTTSIEMQVWPVLIVLAILLTLAELVLRKGGALWRALNRQI